ncbi:MAG TPA: substrate-binding domain-containing protein [Gaiellaceae bacterium]|nr:substrate-binding domain-containing protein [Gaiellaceae bacterium]
MKRFVITLVVAALAVGLTVGGASATSSGAGQTADVCFLLPDPKTSVRWETQDRPAFIAAAKKAKISYVITNADGDPQKQRSQADQCLANGAKVVILVSLDFGSSIAIERAAKAKGARVIEYDRQVVGGVGDIYISFDGKRVGVLQGTGVVRGLKANGRYDDKPVVARLNGGPTDNNSYLFKSGYDSVLNPLFKNGTFVAGPSQFVPGWDNQKARTIFEQMLVRTGNKIDAVAAANDGLANAVVTALKAKKLKPIPLSGQDATELGVQNIISGWQTMTVWKDTRKLATASVAAAVAFLKGQKPKTTGTVPNKGKRLPAFIIPPQYIDKANYKVLFTAGYLKRSNVCRGEYAKYCK